MAHSLQRIAYQRLKDLFIKAPSRVSFEFFPPKSVESEEKLWATLQWLAPLQPAFVSVTYGAGGSTRERTHATVARILRETPLTPAAHLTCVGASREEIDAIAQSYWELGVRHIVALRGDCADGRPYVPHPQGYAYASDLVAGLKKIGDFEISVAAYPEVHPQAFSRQQDFDNLKRKIDAGANRAITQFFFDADIYLRFRDMAARRGIQVPMVPGILPVTHFAQLKRFAGMSGTAIPNWIEHLFDGLDDNPELRNLVAASITAEQCRLLRGEGVDEFHFYTLNRARLTVAICHILGIRPKPASDGAE
ncbi:MAG: methylenetetrahydrofolate reductase [NAD(P)H] [Rickettsiales bacterium]|nr:methylenetetrahydrofolate reductase [NAD(P)H] [Rickettsiales bacterium]